MTHTTSKRGFPRRGVRRYGGTLDIRRRRCTDRNTAVELVYCAVGAHTFVHIVALPIVASAPTSDSMSPESL